MKRLLKTALCVFVIAFAGTSQLYAVNTNARIILAGTFANETQQIGKNPEFDFFTLGSKEQKDADGIVFDVAGENFGGRMGLWYKVDNKTGSDTGSKVSFRRSNLWFMPLSFLKVTVGYVGNDQLYKERIDSWKVGSPFKYDSRDWSKHPGYINCSDVDDMGFGLELRPIDGLVITGGMARRAGAPGSFGHAFFTNENGENVFDAWGVTGRYYFNDFCVQLSYRDNGSKQWKVARVALGYEGNGFYGFVQPCFGIDWNATTEKYDLSGICLDLYGEYKIDSWVFMGHVPVTFRLSGTEDDPNYLEYSFMVKYNLGNVGNMSDITPSLRFGSVVQDGDNEYAVYRLNSQFADSVNFSVAPGISFNAGPCSFSTSVNVTVHSNLDQKKNKMEKVEWSIPFAAVLKF